jgi:NAD(P)-dependent dehydrogenase (short-subunit alcohol dehydrogenase family)
LNGRWHAIVTGSSGGIGRAVCSQLLQEGHEVTGIDSTLLLAAPWRQIQADLSVGGEAFAAGLRAKAHAPVSHVVHCAAVQILGGAGQVADDVWMATLRVNLLAVDELVRATIDDLKALAGSIVVVSSVHATATTRGMAAYATSKAALHGWVRAAALDLAPEVRVNAVQPGAVRTQMLTRGFERRPEDGSVEEALGLLASKTPLQLVAEPGDIAEVVRVLLSPAFNRFVTGSIIAADGGALLRLGTE